MIQVLDDLINTLETNNEPIAKYRRVRLLARLILDMRKSIVVMCTGEAREAR